MHTTKLGKLTAHLAGGIDRNGSGDGPLVVLLHGFGAPGTDLVSLARELDVPAETRFVFPEAPLTVDFGFGEQGRAWWHVNLPELQASIASGRFAELPAEPKGLPESRELMVELLQAIFAASSDQKIVLGGFSQGAMLACDVAFRTEVPLAGLVSMSGTFLGREAWLAGAERRRGMPVLVSHGRQDPLLPYAVSERLHAALCDAQLHSTFVPFSGGHGISSEVLAALGGFVRRIAEPAS
jgi:phospholipase/carboxylesterase